MSETARSLPNGTTSQDVSRSRVMPVIALAVIMVSSSASSLNLALPSIASDTGANQTQLLWIVDAYSVPLSALLLAAGALGDRYGRRLILISGLSLFGAAALVASVVSAPEALIVCRALMGISGAMVMPTTLSIITTTLPREQRASAVGMWVGLAGGGAVVGLLASAILLEYFDWNSVFVLTVILAVAAIIGAATMLSRDKADNAQRLDLLGALLSLLGIGSIVVGLLEGSDRGWSDPLVLVLLIGGLCLLALLVWHEFRTDQPMIDPRIFTIRGVEAGAVSVFVLSFAAYGFIYMLTQYLQFVGGLSTLKVVAAMIPFALVMIPASRFTPALAARFGGNRVTPAGFVVAAVGFGLCATLSVDVDYFVLTIGLVLIALGLALVTTPSTTAIVGSLPDRKQGVASAVSQTSREIAGAVGVALLGAVLNSGYSNSLSDKIPAGAPAGPAEQAEASIAAANAIAKQIGPNGQALTTAAANAFVHGFGTALVVATAVALLGAVYAALRSPRQHSATNPTTPPEPGSSGKAKQR
ncbi:MFS transporter [Nocardia australiensis]|uniref:MFS transporter n=1 Tax=Nocardia australiensis TaxID=2887191 RepID=UPI001D135DAC|nr:MFS transporter [Nocardia australiensis]